MYKGVLISLFASFLFGLMYFYTTLLKPLNGFEVLGWRMLVTVPMLTLFIVLTKEWRLIQSVWHRVRQTPPLALVILVTASINATQFWLFLWAPMNGRGLEVSLGYFLLPLSMVCVGCIFYNEPLSIFKKFAVGFALISVLNQFFYLGHIAVETLVVALGYPLYFHLRRLFKLDHLGTFWIELTLALPISIYFIATYTQDWNLIFQRPTFLLAILGLGVIGASAGICYITASKVLPFTLFGLLSYLEPILLAIVSLLLGETMQLRETLTYSLMGMAVLCLAWEGVVILQQGRNFMKNA